MMINSVKKLVLPLVISGSVTSVCFAKPDDSGLFDSQIFSDIAVSTHQNMSSSIGKGSQLFEDIEIPSVDRKSYDVSNIFEFPQSKKVVKNDPFLTQKATEYPLSDSSIFFPDLPKKEETLPDLAATIFDNINLEKAAELVRLERERLEKARDRKEQDDLIAQQKEDARRLYEEFMSQRAAPTYSQIFANYAYSAGKMALTGADYIARSWVGAYAATYFGIEFVEEAIAYSGYVASAGFTAWCTGGNMTIGKYVGNATYKSIKGGFKVCHTVFPCWEGGISYVAADKVKKAINFTLDTAPGVITGAISAVNTTVSFFRSIWS
jgi:hypothetical protein